MTLFVGVCDCPARIMPTTDEAGAVVCVKCGKPWVNATMLALKLRVLAKNLPNVDPKTAPEFADALYLASQVITSNRAGSHG